MAHPVKPEVESALESVLQSSGNIDTFLDTFFSFLARRTDFFLECPPEGGRYGFPRGHSEALMRSKFKKWQEHLKTSEPTLPKIQNPASSSGEETNTQKKISPTTIKSEKKQDPESAAASKNEAYNGRVTDKYSWSQTINEVDVNVPVSKEILKGKQVKVSIETNHLLVSLVGNPEPIINEKLSFAVKKDDCYWNLVPGDAITIWLQKSQERWWQALIEGEELLEMSRIEAVRPMEDLDQEEQMKLQELCWNEERKRQGLPTSEDLKMQNTLKDAWNLEGSPFKGQPFDPSLVQIGNQGSFPAFPTTPKQ